MLQEPENLAELPEERDNFAALPKEQENLHVLPERRENFAELRGERENFAALPEKQENISQLPEEQENLRVLPKRRENFVASSDSRKRRRKPAPHLWKKNMAKHLRQSGQEYVNCGGKLIQKKEPKIADCTNCRYLVIP